jgi:hypothetical protein
LNNASNIFGVENTYYKREVAEFHQREDKIASSANWNSVAASKTPNNKGTIDAYKMR